MESKNVATLLQKTAAYVEQTQPIVDEYNRFKNAFTKAAHQAVGALVTRGIVEETKADTLVDRLSSDPKQAFRLVTKLAEMIGADNLGGASKEKVAASNLDPFEKLAVYGDVNADDSTTGLVD